MKHLVGFTVAILVMIAMHLLSDYVLKFNVSEFFIGWISCVGYFAGRDGYDECRKHGT